MELVIIRTKENEKQTIGTGLIIDNAGTLVHNFCTLELPFINNKRFISCIPVGNYEVVKRNSLKYGNHFWIKNVQNRSLILIHQGNFYKQTKGCIVVGIKHIQIDLDGYLDVNHSKTTMITLNKILPLKFNLKIIQLW